MNLATMFANTDISWWAALTAGIVSFFSPCVLPLLPAWLTLVTGMNLDEIKEADKIKYSWLKILPQNLLFVLGFSLVYALLGATFGLVGELLREYGHYLRYVAATFMILFGVYLTGFMTPKFLMREKRVEIRHRPVGLLAPFLVGMGFAVGWVPCQSPILGSILALATVEQSVTDGMLLLAVYSLGLGLPFLIISLAVDKVLRLLQKARPILKHSNLILGIMLILMGVLLASGQLTYNIPH